MEEARHDPSVIKIRCVTVLADGSEISTPRQLANFVGDKDLLVWNHHEDHMDWCLCAIDVAESLRVRGVKWRYDSGKYLIERTLDHHV